MIALGKDYIVSCVCISADTWTMTPTQIIMESPLTNANTTMEYRRKTK